MLEARCPHCGKWFIPAPQHAMRDSRGAYCKPTCWIHRNDGIENSYKRKGQKVIQCNLDGAVVKMFDTLAEAGRSLYCSAQSIGRACRHKEVYRGYKWRYAEENEVSDNASAV